jgi:hypothetical protein
MQLVQLRSFAVHIETQVGLIVGQKDVPSVARARRSIPFDVAIILPRQEHGIISLPGHSIKYNLRPSTPDHKLIAVARIRFDDIGAIEHSWLVRSDLARGQVIELSRLIRTRRFIFICSF